MTNCVDEFETLLKDMETALVKNDAQKVSELTVKQQQCLTGIVEKAKQDEILKKYAQSRYPFIVKQLQFNDQLLKQAISITDALVSSIYGAMGNSVVAANRLTNRTFSA